MGFYTYFQAVEDHNVKLIIKSNKLCKHHNFNNIINNNNAFIKFPYSNNSALKFSSSKRKEIFMYTLVLYYFSCFLHYSSYYVIILTIKFCITILYLYYSY